MGVFEEHEPQRHQYKFRGLTFNVTCPSCPEQYDVFDEVGFNAGYIRLRFGGLSVEYPEVLGRRIFHRSYNRELMGNFDTEQERTNTLSQIADIIRHTEKKRIRRVNPTNHLSRFMNKFVDNVMKSFDR